ncbi:hypothetical protein GGS21DRAFT_546065 [Xylaria nigripes]|nr:hypothetical protein GGS21DRAFT_546065 [Xylaria nigripes]
MAGRFDAEEMAIRKEGQEEMATKRLADAASSETDRKLRLIKFKTEADVDALCDFGHSNISTLAVASWRTRTYWNSTEFKVMELDSAAAHIVENIRANRQGSTASNNIATAGPNAARRNVAYHNSGISTNHQQQQEPLPPLHNANWWQSRGSNAINPQMNADNNNEDSNEACAQASNFNDYITGVHRNHAGVDNNDGSASPVLHSDNEDLAGNEAANADVATTATVAAAANTATSQRDSSANSLLKLPALRSLA